METVEGKPEPTPSDAIANPKIIPPMHASLTHVLFSISPSANNV